jgi:hypothetical protein
MTIFIPWCLPAFFGFVGIASLVGGWLWEPLDRAAKDRNCPPQFTLADIFCLFLWLQLALGAVHWEARGREASWPWLIGIDAILSFWIATAWWSLVRKMSRAGIRATRHRCLVLLTLAPVTGLGCLVMAVPIAAFDMFTTQSYIFWDVCSLLSITPFAGGVYAIGRFIRAAVASAPKE